MKNLIITITVLSLLGITLNAQNKIVERPAFSFWNSQTLEIDKIELSDTETVVYIDAFFRPNNWIRIASDTYIRETGKTEKLLITKSEGINLDEEFFMPASGETSFKLFFPPIGKDVTQIDLIESDCDECFKIWGIYLDGTVPVAHKMPADAAIKEDSSNKPLPIPQVKSGNAIFSGKVFGENIPQELLKGSVYVYNPLTQSGEEMEIKLSSDGTFKMDIPLVISPNVLHVSSSFFRGSFPVEVGVENKLYVDFSQNGLKQSRYQRDKVSGDRFAYSSANTIMSFQDLNQIDKIFEELYYSDREEPALFSPEEYKVKVYDKLKKLKDKTDSITSSPVVRGMLSYNWDLITISNLMRYERIMLYAYAELNKIPYDGMDTITFKAEKPGKEYYTFLKDFDLNNPYFLYSGYSGLIESLRENETIGVPERGQKSLSQWLPEVKKVLKEYTGIDSGIFYDMLVAKEYGAQLNDLKLLSANEIKDIESNFSNKSFVSELLAQNVRIEKIIKQTKTMDGVVLHETPDVEKEKMMDEILSKYKGKVVFVDFWATWCGPCIQAMKTAEPVKAEFADKDVVFLYLTGDTSPAADFQKMLPTIHGEHFRVTKEVWDYWGKAIPVRGVPMYIIFDKEGKEIRRSTGFMGVEKMKEWLNEGLQ